MKPPSKLSVLVLAAGYSSRMGAFKPLLPLGPTTLLERVVKLFQCAGIEDIRVVVGHRAEEIEPSVRALGARAIFNPEYPQGMFSSILAGVKALEADVRAFFLLPTDIPLVREATIRTLIDAHRHHPTCIIYPRFLDLRGHPPLIPVDVLRDELSTNPRGGLRDILSRHEGEAVDVDVIDEGILTDCDTMADFERLQARLREEHFPSRRECEALWAKYDVPENVVNHCCMVAEWSRILAIRLNQVGLPLDAGLTAAAARVHDLVKGHKDHAYAGGSILRELGFPRVADIVASHMELPSKDGSSRAEFLDESDLVYLADKLIRGDEFVSLEERFRGSISRFCSNPEILRAVLRRYEDARRIKSRIEELLQTPLENLAAVHERSLRACLHGRQRTLYLARHGAIETNGSGRTYIGQSDLPLSSEGIRQAEMLQEKLRDTPLTAIYCSDLKRSIDTAEIVAGPHGIKPQPLPELREIHLGEWEGMDFETVRRDFPGEFEARGLDIVGYRPPGGESFQDCALRVIPALYHIFHSTRGDILIVGHAGVNRIILSQVMGADLKDLFKIRQEYCCLDRIFYNDHQFSMA